MFVLGVDPGVSRCGYGCISNGGVSNGGISNGDRGRGGLSVLAMGVITTPPSDELPVRLATLDAELRRLLAELRPDAVAVERLFFQTNARTAMSVGQASGLVLAAASATGARVVQYTPNEVKQAVAGYGAAPKDQVQRMVQAQLKLADRPEPADVADALALALCHLAMAPLEARVRAASDLRVAR
jgi:crossover junction endodeoxyribonuclease RuvC